VEIDPREGIEERSGRIEEEATYVIFDVDVGAEFRETTSDVEGGRRPQHGVVHSRPAVLYINTRNHTLVIRHVIATPSLPAAQSAGI